MITTIVIPYLEELGKFGDTSRFTNTSKTTQEQTLNVSKTTINKSSNLIIKNTTNIVKIPTEQQKSLDIPSGVLIGMGLIVLIMLAPVIRSAKVGPVELTIIDMPTTPTANLISR